MDTLGRYYTKDKFSELLIKNLENEHPQTILDLGVGAGSLIRAAHNRWKNAKFIAADVDPLSVKSVSKNLPFIKIFKANGLKINIERSILINKSTIDIAVCNPPYLAIKEKKRFENLFCDAELRECLNLKKITSDIVFLAQNLKLLRENGELGIILPDSILTGQEYIPLRQALLNNHRIKALIELPERIFAKTEAKTHIAIIEKGETTTNKIPLFIAGKNGDCVDQIDIDSSLLEHRMDFSYHKADIKLKKVKNLQKLRDFEYKLFRGNKGNADLRESGIKYLHSTSFKNADSIECGKRKQDGKKYILAETGDLIIVRVGRRCVGKSALILSGQLPVSDCLYVIKAKKDVIKGIWKFITSKEGEVWLKANSHGTCAKVLNRADIGNIPIIQ